MILFIDDILIYAKTKRKARETIEDSVVDYRGKETLCQI
jgi:hypothetical protein